MSEETLEISDSEKRFRELIVREYLHLGSVNKLLTIHPQLPFSEPSIHRILNEYGVVRAVGRKHASLSQIIFFFAHFAKQNIPLSSLYKEMPPSFKPSAETLHRVYKSVRKNVTRASAVALIISPQEHPDKILLGHDISEPQPWLGKHYGNLSIPMGYAGKNDYPGDSIKRILQREVFSEMVIKKIFPDNLIPDTPPVAEVQVLDVNVRVYRLLLPPELHTFSSRVLSEHRFLAIEEILMNKSLSLREGVIESIQGYLSNLNHVHQLQLTPPVRILSRLNLALSRSHLYR